MKKLLFLMSAIMMITISSFSQTQSTELTGAVGLTFGSDKATVKSILSTKGTYYVIDSPDALAFTKVSVGSKIAEFVLCKFVNNKLYRIVCSFLPEAESTSKAQDLYDEFISILTTKYGKAFGSFRQFEYPFKDESDDWDSAIRCSKATINSFWFVPNKEGNSIELSINKDFSIRIEYQSKALMDIAVEKEKNKNVNEF